MSKKQYRRHKNDGFAAAPALVERAEHPAKPAKPLVMGKDFRRWPGKNKSARG